MMRLQWQLAVFVVFYVKLGPLALQVWQQRDHLSGWACLQNLKLWHESSLQDLRSSNFKVSCSWYDWLNMDLYTYANNFWAVVDVYSIITLLLSPLEHNVKASCRKGKTKWAHGSSNIVLEPNTHLGRKDSPKTILFVVTAISVACYTRKVACYTRKVSQYSGIKNHTLLKEQVLSEWVISCK